MLAPDATAALARLGLTRDSAVGADHAKPLKWADPREQPLLHEYIGAVLRPSSGSDAGRWDELESDIDRLRSALVAQRLGETERLNKTRLESLAEMAAGASHEINNPLAVISGQSQYLLNREDDPEQQKSLKTIIRQAQRIHQLLAELMRFAKPSEPRRETIDPLALVREVIAELSSGTAHTGVTVEISEACQSVGLRGDRGQLHFALANLVRNGVEAAGSDGWVRVRFEQPDLGYLRFVVEDSGIGPNAVQRRHLFDPFYSGRPAGRGKGLGLPTAWRVARDHGGDVRFEPTVGGPTRFVLVLPLTSAGPDVGPITPVERRIA
jgi:signal transduction histidine kinase